MWQCCFRWLRSLQVLFLLERLFSCTLSEASDAPVLLFSKLTTSSPLLCLMQSVPGLGNTAALTQSTWRDEKEFLVGKHR